MAVSLVSSVDRFYAPVLATRVQRVDLVWGTVLGAGSWPTGKFFDPVDDCLRSLVDLVDGISDLFSPGGAGASAGDLPPGFVGSVEEPQVQRDVLTHYVMLLGAVCHLSEAETLKIVESGQTVMKPVMRSELAGSDQEVVPAPAQRICDALSEVRSLLKSLLSPPPETGSGSVPAVAKDPSSGSPKATASGERRYPAGRRYLVGVVRRVGPIIALSLAGTMCLGMLEFLGAILAGLTVELGRDLGLGWGLEGPDDGRGLG